MDKLSIYIKTTSDGKELSFSPVNDRAWEIYISLVCIFGTMENGNITIPPAQIASQDLKAKVHQFVNDHQEEFPHLNSFRKFVIDLPDREYFLVLPEKLETTREDIDVETYISALNKSDNELEVQAIFRKSQEEINNSFGEILDSYNLISPRIDRRTYIGERAKKSRVCRFCNRSIKDGVSFKKVAHAIPEALGNKNLVLCEECDDCNSFFGDNIEPTLIESLDILRVFTGLKGKNGLPTIKHKNGKMYFGDGGMVIESSGAEKISDSELIIKLDSPKKYVPLKFYKALCKIALSAINSEEIEYLKDTISWLRYGNISKKVPVVAVNALNSMTTILPTIRLYVRKDNSTLPHVVCEFKVANFIYVFILPFSSKDSMNYINEKEYSDFWVLFKHYNLVDGWRFNDYNSNKEIVISESIRMIKNNIEKTISER